MTDLPNGTNDIPLTLQDGNPWSWVPPEQEMAKFEVLEEPEWLDLHRDPAYFSASRVSTLLGLNKWEDTFDLWNRFKGKLEWPADCFRFDMGHAAEHPIAKAYWRQKHRQVMDPGPYTIVRHAKYPQLFATIDRLIDGNGDGPGPLEAKTIHALMEDANEYKEESAPRSVLAQVQTQMACGGWKWASIGGAVGWGEVYFCDVRAHAGFQNAILKAVDAFLDILKGDIPPNPGAHSRDTLNRLFPTDDGATVALDDELALEHLAAYHQHKAELTAADNAVEVEKNWFLNEIGDAKIGTFAGKKVSFPTIAARQSITVGIGQASALDDAGIPYGVTGMKSHRRGNFPRNPKS